MKRLFQPASQPFQPAIHLSSQSVHQPVSQPASQSVSHALLTLAGLQVKAEVEGGIGWLLQKREQDPYRPLLPRLIYEASRGGAKAPSFTP